jgi:ArsR family transcriptional regulator, arsenate/arsenite/antimonite-responsive transcriptional repressor
MYTKFHIYGFSYKMRICRSGDGLMLDPVAFFKSLADDTRLRMLLLICREQELCVCELTAALDLSQPKVSRHLAQLRKVGLLLDRRQGQWVYYRLHSELVDWAKSVIELSLQENQTFLQDNLDALALMGEDRPQRIQACC